MTRESRIFRTSSSLRGYILRYDAATNSQQETEHEAFRSASSYRRRHLYWFHHRVRSVSRRSPQAGGVFTAAQAQAGQAAYAQQCAGCHGQDFRGSADAPSLQGEDFRAKWGPRAVNELFTTLVQTMPPTNPGALGEEGTLEVTAFLLQINGARAGQQALTARVETPIGTLLVGPAQAPAPAAGGRGGRRRRAQPAPMVVGAGTAARGGRGGEPNRGVTVAGRSEELRARDAGDAQESAAGRLADFPPQLSGPQPQPAESDHARQREEPAAAVGVGDERFGREPDDADRSQRRHLSRDAEQHRPGARRERRAV